MDDSEPQLTNINFDRDDIIQQIDSLSANAAAGPDGVPALPQLMKLAFVIPIHKGGSRGLPVNFRPVSLTSHIMKILERLVREVLVIPS